MDVTNRYLAEKLSKIQQEKHRQERQEQIERKRRMTRDSRLYRIIGERFLFYFPEFQRLEPKRTKQENDAEFSPLDQFLKKIKIENNDSLNRSVEENFDKERRAL